MTYRKIRAIISGGGTGGHIFPALSIAGKLKELNPETEILFVGADGRMEMEKVPAAGYKIVGLPVAGLQRKLTLSNFALPFKVIKSVSMAKKVIRLQERKSLPQPHRRLDSGVLNRNIQKLQGQRACPYPLLLHT